MKIHLIDGTYELFRAHFGAPPTDGPDKRPVGAVRGLIRTLISLLNQADVTHVACAFDHVIESFRNNLFPGYKTSKGISQDLINQFVLAETAVATLGLVTWPMIKFEADDAIATATHRWGGLTEVDQVIICSPDKDLTQLVSGNIVVCLDRRKKMILNEEQVVKKFGVEPRSIPDYLALVGDAADGIPGIPGWGKKSASTLLYRYKHIETIPKDPRSWDVNPRGAKFLSQNLNYRYGDALLYRNLTTLRKDVPLKESLEDLEWKGVLRNNFTEMCLDLKIKNPDNLLKVQRKSN